MPKIEYTHCIKCCSLIELVYLPNMSTAAKEVFKTVEETGLCVRCAAPMVREPVKPYLH